MEHKESPILQGLNPAQLAAVVNYDSPSLIIAGAGSGKTRVLTARIAYMIEQGVAPFNILALTFTNKAAQQMRERIAQMIPDNRSRYIRMGTFHSVFSRILRENAEKIGFPESFTIYEPSDCKNLIKTIVRELNLADEKYKPNLIASRISYAKNCLVTPGAYLANSVYAAEDRQAQIPEFGNVYNIYCQRCKRNGAMDFDDLLLQTNILLRDAPDVLARYQELFKYILVDEYQDTNYAQYVIIRRLSQLHSRVCVVGDDAQSIYSFRGAKIENILSFQKDFPAARVFKLEQNYRSTRTIVDAANSVIVRNSKRMEKHCFSAGDVGEPIRILKAYTDREEAEMVVSDLRDKVRSAGDDWSEAVILYRTNNQSAVLEDNLRRRGIPYRIYKGSSFYDHKEVKDMLAYIRLVINPRDDEAFKRIVNYPTRGIGDTTVQRIAQLAAERGVSMWEAVDALVAEPAADPVQKTIARKVADFVAMIRSLSLARNEKGLYDFGLEDRHPLGYPRGLPCREYPRGDLGIGQYRGVAELDAGVQGAVRRRNPQRGASAGRRGDHRGVAAERHAGDRHGQGRPRRPQQGDTDDRPLGQGAGIQIRVYRRAGGKPLPLAAGRRVARRHGGGAAPVLRGAYPCQGRGDDLLRRDAFQVGQHGVLAPELLPARDRPEICQGRLRYRHRRRPPAPLARRIRTFGHRRTAPPLRLPFPAETAGCGREQWRRPAGQQPRPRQFRRPPPPTANPAPQGVSPGLRHPATPARRGVPTRRSSRPRAPRPTACAASVCGRRPTAAYPSAIRCPSAAIIPWDSASSTPNSAWVSCSASRPSPPTTSWSWPSTARAKRPCWPNSPN